MLEAQASASTDDPGVFASYEDAVAWMDSFDDNDDDGSNNTIMQSNVIDLNGLQDSDSDTKSHRSPPHQDARVVLLQDSSAPTSPEAHPIAPPPSSQSYFDRYPVFKPDPTASFEEEFRRCMALQSVTPGSQEYRRNRTHAISHELKFLYSQPPPAIPEENESDDERDVRGVIPQTLGIAGLDMDSPEFRLGVYQNMCRKVNLEPRNTISACTYDLKHKILVNIYDFIDAQRLGGKLKLWQDFTEFSAYCLEPGKCMDLKVAKKDKFLKFLLQRLVRTKRSRPSRKLDLRKEKRKKRGNTPRTHSKRHRS